jgi:RecJ-like exonuclease
MFKKISLIFSLIGIALILFLMQFNEPKITEITKIKNPDMFVKVSGKIVDIKKYPENFTVIKIKDPTGEITGICNCPLIKENQNIEIIGKTSIYKRELQINIEKIYLIK